MARLRFIIGNITDFRDLGIDQGSCRTSIDGTKMIIHQEELTDDQFDAILSARDEGKLFDFMSADNPALTTLLESVEWSAVDPIQE